ncbi:MAG: FRG domain-containing protein [Bryobacteraceae bacterium]
MEDQQTAPETLLTLLKEGNCVVSVSTVAEYVELVSKTCDDWQSEDWSKTETDEDALNDARIVDQVWFRGQPDNVEDLKPGLYREDTWAALKKSSSACRTAEDIFDALFDIEMDQRIDFTNYGHLLNESNQAKTHIDWYFLMQHHGVPTRLLDWTTNALAALFFALEKYSRPLTRRDDDSQERAEVSIWVVDAYWLAGKISKIWDSPILPYSEEAGRYVAPLDKLIERMREVQELLPQFPMPIEPPAMHPRVAAQEGRFIIFGKNKDLLEQPIRLTHQSGKTEILRLKRIRFHADDASAILRDLSHLGVSRRTLFPDLAGLADFVRWKHFHRVRNPSP